MVNSTNIFWYLLGKMSIFNQKMQIQRSTDFLNLLQTQIESIQTVASQLFGISVGDFSSDQLEQKELDDIRQEIERKVLNFLQKLSNSTKLNSDELELSRILDLYNSLDCQSSGGFIEQLTDHLKEIQNISDDLKKLIVSTTTCNESATCYYNKMDEQIRTVVRAISWRHQRSRKYKEGLEVHEKAYLREKTKEEKAEAFREQAKSYAAIKAINAEVEKILKRLQDMTNELNQLSKLFSEISEEFKSLAENPSFFDFMMRLFQGQICETTFSHVSINFQYFYSSLQTTIANMFPYMGEIYTFKHQKEAENASRQQDRIRFFDREQANINEWREKDDAERNRRWELEAKTRSPPRSNE